MRYTETLRTTEFLIALSCHLITQDINSYRMLTNARFFFSVRHQLIAEAFAKRNLAIELQRDWCRVSRAAAEQAAIQNEFAAIRRKSLLILQIKCRTHLLQRAIAATENMRRELLTTLEENRYLTKECQLQRQDLRRITAMTEQVRLQKQNILIQLRRQRQREAEEAEAYTVAIAQLRVSF